ncbi:MAG TPA: DUF4398 domain-containing protein [Woeseiaceae bacterium]|nr:DUF4398 domain-containing protein [Woeseiaceae bacterium]
MNKLWKTPGTMLLALPLAILCACASGPDRPFQDLARAEASIEQADQTGAREYGATELAAARDKLAKARAAADSDDNVVASRYAKEAAVDAELATAITRNRKAELAVEELNRSIETLREEIARNQSRSGDRQ